MLLFSRRVRTREVTLERELVYSVTNCFTMLVTTKCEKKDNSHMNA